MQTHDPNRPLRLSPSLMTMDLPKFQEQIGFLDGKVESYHVDVMDGHFVANLSLSPWFIQELRKISDTPVSAHVMVNDPAFWTEELVNVGADVIVLHAEVLNGLAYRLADEIHAAGRTAGVALNPETPVSVVEPYLGVMDKVTLMTVDPGFAGQRFLPECLQKVQELTKLRENEGLQFDIEIDGSFNAKSFQVMWDAGADIYVIGRSGLFGLANLIEESWQRMQDDFLEITA